MNAMRVAEIRPGPRHNGPTTSPSRGLRIGAIGTLGSLSFLVPIMGCLRPETPFFQVASSSIVWPEPPEVPRVRYLGQFGRIIGAPSKRSTGVRIFQWLHGPESPVGLVTPHAVAVDPSGDWLAIADPGAGVVHVLNLVTERYAVYGGGASPLQCPIGVTWMGGEVCVVDAKLHEVRCFTSNRGIPEGTANPRSGSGPMFGPERSFGRSVLRRPSAIAHDPSGDRIVVSDAETHALLLFSPDGRLTGTMGRRGSGPGALNYPAQVACSSRGDIVVADAMNFRIQRFSADGADAGSFGEKSDVLGGFALPKGVALDAEGNIWVSDAQFENVQAFDGQGRLLLAFGEEGNAPGEFWLPAGVAIDRNHRLWVADSYNRRVQGFQLIP